ncbi:MAG TPA: bifunctional hydroxymethylpyrimidine kinase/phosphomethylpyrimidine kinase [Kiritimatiellia bacterium]|mgnify:FL=1|nr:bifunctional hydroxymethylpyrimidine kinase/phosphomethylpyrimidine kinase [Kiritimatiellia bacterium]HPK37132.1 bifunctional hydroxymethylpyrimidine kinase/phosphomethylpyrimidine kinase [Kiritimatiellia bacterium]
MSDERNDECACLEPVRLPVALTIAGSDSGGNAGIQADLRAFHVFGVHGCTVIAALTAQNPFGVRAVLTADAAFVAEQLDTVLDVYGITALKTGMLACPEVIEAVADCLVCHNRIAKVIDPVMVATSGARLLAEDALEMLTSRLLPLATLLTPNLAETEVLLGSDRTVLTLEAMQEAARELADRFGCAVLVKGGHADSPCAEDVLYDGAALHRVTTPRLVSPASTHGTGCSLSAAIAASLALGRPLVEAVTEGKAYVYESIRTGAQVGEVATVLGTPTRLPCDRVTVETV